MAQVRSKRDGEDRVKMATEEMAKKFCPMAQRNCVPNCVCYEAGRVQNPVDPNTNIYAFEPYCKHPYVEGNLVVNVEN
jgi:hypothetical protein